MFFSSSEITGSAFSPIFASFSRSADAFRSFRSWQTADVGELVGELVPVDVVEVSSPPHAVTPQPTISRQDRAAVTRRVANMSP